MKKLEKISIIIVNWNGKKWLKKCLNSLKNQTYKNLEIIVVDNASYDDSISYMSKNFPKVKTIRNKKNLGFSSGNNIGIKASLGEYIILLNSDTWVENDFVEKLVKFYKANNFSVISPIETRYFTKEPVAYSATIDPTGAYVYLPPEKRTKKMFFLPGISLFFSKKVYLETKGLDSDFFMYFEDVDWFWRLILLKKTFAYAEGVNIYHLGAGGTGYRIRYNMFLWRNKNILQMLLKNYSTPTLIIILPIYFVQNIAEIIFFFIILKPKIAFSYIEGWIFNLSHLRQIRRKRVWIQKNRAIGDFEIMKRMYFGSGKLVQLKQRLNIL